MSKFAYAQNNFSSGELSPKLQGRNDIQEYINGASEMLNSIPLKSGGTSRRPGSIFVKDITADFHPDYEVHVFEFTPTRAESYSIAIGVDISGTTCGIKIYKQDDNYPVGLTAVTANIDGALGPPLLELFTNYVDKINEFHTAQASDFIFFTHSSRAIIPIVFIRTSSTVFEVTNYDRAAVYANQPGESIRQIPFQGRNTIAANIMTTSGGAVPNRTLTASGAGFTPFVSTMVGTYVRLSNGTSAELVMKITAYVSPTVVSVTVLSPLTGVADISNYRWAFGSWSRHFGYPGAVTLYQGKIIFGGTRHQPNSGWLSVTGNLFLMFNYKLVQDSSTDTSGLDYFGPITDADAFDIEVLSDQSGIITYLSSDRYVQIGTTNGEHVLLPVDGVLGPTKKSISNQTFFGSKPIPPVKMSNATIFCTISGKNIQENTFSEENAQSAERELSVLADHLVYHGRDEDTQSSSASEYDRAFYQKTRKCTWFVTNNGALVGVVNDRSGGVLAWFKCQLGGTIVKVDSVIALPAPSGGAQDGLYMVVRRVINGVKKIYIERIGEDFEQDSLYGEFTLNQRDVPVYSDSAYIQISAIVSANSTSLTADHLRGETVVVVHKGLKVGVYVVPLSGPLVIPVALEGFIAGQTTIVGLPYTSRVVTTPIEAGSQIGNSHTGLKRIDTVSFRLLRTMGGSFSSGKKVYKLFSSADSINLFTGIRKVKWDATPSEETKVIIEQSDPYPMTVLMIVMRGNTEE